MKRSRPEPTLRRNATPYNSSTNVSESEVDSSTRLRTKNRDVCSSTELVYRIAKKMKTEEDSKPEPPKTDESGKKGKKVKKEKHKLTELQGTKASKTSSFVRKLNLGKYMSSPSGSRRSLQSTAPTRSVSTELESDTSDKQSSASSTLTPSSVKRHSPEGDAGVIARISVSELSIADDTDDIGSRSNLSEEGVRFHEPVSTKPYAISTWKDIKPVKVHNEEPVRKRIAWVHQSSVDPEQSMDNEDSDGVVTVRRHSSGDEVTSKRTRAGSISGARSEEAFQDALPGVEEDRTESAEETEVATTAAAAATDTEARVSEEPTMPAFGDLIMEPQPKDHKQQSTSVLSAQSTSERREHLYKILVIGELGTGKTSIIKRYVHQFFSQHYRATIGVDFALKVLNWDANTIIRLQLWDIAGQERFGNMTRVYYKDAVGAFIVFDVTRVATFDAVVKWKEDLDSKVQLSDGSPIPCVLLGNKCDQQKEGIVNTPTRMEDFCKEKGFSGWFETSAKENINIEEAARFLVNKILLNDKLLHNSDASKDSERIAIDGKDLNGQKTGQGSKSCSC